MSIACDNEGLSKGLDEAAARLVELGRARGLTVSTAESCTAGMVAAAIADIPGASAVLRGGAVTYCDQVKHRVLGVSGQTAREMAQGSRRLFDASVAVSLTGYAGPGGGTDTEPAGTVYIAVSDASGTRCERCSFTGTRNGVRRQAALRALEMVAESLESL